MIRDKRTIESIDDTVNVCFPTCSDQFKDSAKDTLEWMIATRSNQAYPLRPESLSMINRVMLSTYDLIYEGSKSACTLKL